MQRIVIRYLSGSRANQADAFPADSAEGVIAGRDPLAPIRFDAEQDDLVSRQHLKIARDTENPNMYRLVDMQSRNGTFVNRRRVYGSTFLNHNDRVQLGPAGPEFRFELDPPPVTVSPSNGSSPSFATGATNPTPTREAFAPYTRESAEAGSPRPVGRATVERMLDDTFGLLKQESSKSVIIGLLCIASILIVGLSTWMYLRKSEHDAVTAQRRSEQAIEGMKTSLEKTREEAQATHEAEARKAQEAEELHQKTLQRLVNEITRMRREQAQQVERQKQSLPQPGNAPVTPVSSAPSYVQLVERVDNLFTENKYSEAAVIANQLMAMDPARYEGYYLGGVSALQQKQKARAKELLTQAIARAPLDRQAPLQQLLNEAHGPKER
ncbi:MAG: hypothetical protein JWP08_823 [Bryobacterales bacterium]|nr:hypothetical protein [Bryobacterales bacterium]